MDVPILGRACGVYAIECQTSGKLYVGSSISIAERLKAHRRKLIKNVHHNIHLQRAWNKHGSDVFRCHVLEICDPKARIDRETFWIAEKKAFVFGFNGCPAASYLANMAPDHKEKLSKRIIQMNRSQSQAQRDAAAERCRKMNKRPLSAEQRLALSEKAKKMHAEGRLNTPEHRARSSERMSVLAKRLIAEGKTHSERHRAASSERMREWNRQKKLAKVAA